MQSGVQWIEAGYALQQKRGILHRAGHRPDVIQRPGERINSVPTHQSIGRFVADDATPGSRIPDRSAGVGSERAEA